MIFEPQPGFNQNWVGKPLKIWDLRSLSQVRFNLQFLSHNLAFMKQYKYSKVNTKQVGPRGRLLLPPVLQSILDSDWFIVGQWAYYSHYLCERLSYSGVDITGPVNNHLGPFEPKMSQIG